MTAHVKAQVNRFLRTFGLSFVALYLQAGGRLSWSSLLALGPATAETLFRQVVKVQEVPAVTSVLAPPGDRPAAGSP